MTEKAMCGVCQDEAATTTHKRRPEIPLCAGCFENLNFLDPSDTVPNATEATYTPYDVQQIAARIRSYADQMIDTTWKSWMYAQAENIGVVAKDFEEQQREIERLRAIETRANQELREYQVATANGSRSAEYTCNAIRRILG